MDKFVKFAGVDKNVVFDNYTLFCLLRAGLYFGDLLVRPESEDDKFCRAWSIVLHEEYTGDVKGFINKFGDFKQFSKLNDIVIYALERDGVISFDPPNKDEIKDGKS